jgi:hypothetical protein
MTLLGCLFIPLGFYIWFAKPRLLLPLAIVASVFQAGSVLNVSGIAIPPYFFVGLLIALTSIGNLVKRNLSIQKPNATSLFLLSFWFWAVISSFFLPAIFEGLRIGDSRSDVVSLSDLTIPLSWSKANLFQAGWLTIDVIVAFFAARQGNRDGARSAMKTAFCLAGAVVALQLALGQFGVVLPRFLFHSNPTQMQSLFGEGIFDRPSGLFSEPSMAGVLFTGMTLAALAQFFEGKGTWKLVGALLITLMVRSTASLLGLGVGIALLGICRLPIERHSVNYCRLYAWFKLLLLFVVIGAFLVFGDGASGVLATTIYKTDTLSFVVRMSNDVEGLRIFLQTYGLGIGPGSIRTSSLLITLLATVGITGTALFAGFIICLLRQCHGPIRWFLVGALLAQVAGVPDVTFPVLWMAIWIAMVPNRRSEETANSRLRSSEILIPDLRYTRSPLET